MIKLKNMLIKQKIGVIFLIIMLMGLIPLSFGDIDEINNIPNAANESRVITDMFGRDVEIPNVVESVVGLGAGALRYIVYMDGSHIVSGVENIEKDANLTIDLRPYIVANPELKELPSVGPMWGGDKELITDVQPDVIITTNENQASDLDSLQNSINIPVIGLIYGNLIDNLEGFWEGLNITSQVLGTQTTFESFKTYVTGIIDDLSERTKDIDVENSPNCYVGGIGFRGTHGIISTKPNYDPFVLINANNIAKDIGGNHAFVDPESIIGWNPDILLIDGGGFNSVLDDIQSGNFDTLKAIKNNDVYILLPYNWYSANFANILIDAYFIGTILFPEQFSDVVLSSKAAEIYENFVGENVFDSMLENFKRSINTEQDALAKLGGEYTDFNSSIPSFDILILGIISGTSLILISIKIKTQINKKRIR